MPLCVYAVTLPAYALVESNRRRTWRIATYMRVFLEPEMDDVQWETRLAQPRHEEQSKRSPTTALNKSEWLVFVLLDLAATVAAILFGLLRMNVNIPVKLFSILLIATVFATYLWVSWRQEHRLERGGQVEQQYLRSWEELKAIQVNSTTRRLSGTSVNSPSRSSG